MVTSKVWARDAQVTLGIDTAMKHHDVAVLADGVRVQNAHIPASAEGIDGLLNRLPNCRVRAIYEVGPDGFGLYRTLQARGLECKVVAPSMVPVEPGLRKRKNNHRDAQRLGMLYEQLRSVRVPTEEEEADRQLVRTRKQLLDHQHRLQCQIQSMLRFAGRRLSDEEGWGTYWSKARMAFLRELQLDQPSRTEALHLLVGMLADVMKRLLEAERQIHRLARSRKYRTLVGLLRTVPGIAVLAAMTFITEIGDPRRFKSPAEVGAYLGLVPQENSTGDVELLGCILPTGNRHLRRILIQCSWVWLRHDARAQAWAKSYLARRWGARGAKQKAITALARKLGIILWAMWRDGCEYTPLPSPRPSAPDVVENPAGRGEAPACAPGPDEKQTGRDGKKTRHTLARKATGVAGRLSGN